MLIFLWIKVTLFQFMKAAFDHQESQFCDSETSKTIFSVKPFVVLIELG